MALLKKGARITGANRTKLASSLKKSYESGASIRELAEQNGRSYGFVHRVLAEAGVTLRGRGGATRAKRTKVDKKPAAAANAARRTAVEASPRATRRAKGK